MSIIHRISVLFCFLIALSASAQEFKPFKVNISLGYAAPVGTGASGGVLISLEPKYGLSDAIDLGLRLETAVVAQSVNVSGSGSNANGTAQVKAFGSYLLTGNYLFSTNNFRPYLGAGLGLYSVAGTDVTIVNGTAGGQNVAVQASSIFGGMIRAGFKASHFNFGVEYNLVPNTKSVFGTNGTVESKNSYIGIKAGIDIGGGRR
jgi:outer membrane protein W